MEDLGNVEAEEIVSDCLKILISAPVKEKIKALRLNIKRKGIKRRGIPQLIFLV